MWRSSLEELVATEQFGTQAALVEALEELGHVVTQSSVSRELKGLGVSKLDGRYVLPVVAGFPAHLTLLDARASLGGPMVVLKTRPANGPILAQAVDRARLHGVLGTVAGDDTVFIACDSPAAIERLEDFLGRHLTGAHAGSPRPHEPRRS